MKKITYALCVSLLVLSVSLVGQTNPATSTTLSSAITASQTTITIGSATGIADGSGLYIDGEFMTVNPSWTSGTQIPVFRGQLGTTARTHRAATTVLKGPVGMFTTSDQGPGQCPSTPAPYLVSVNVVNGNVWWCDANLRWTATNMRAISYNSLTIS